MRVARIQPLFTFCQQKDNKNRQPDQKHSTYQNLLFVAPEQWQASLTTSLVTSSGKSWLHSTKRSPWYSGFLDGWLEAEKPADCGV
jgi:hypothetical protein